MADDPLVSDDWLAERLDDPAVKVMDATWLMPGSGRDAAGEYAQHHIPGAVFFPIDEICDHTSGLPHMLASPAEFAVAARRLGVSGDSTVVVYDSQGLFSAPRVWWSFRVMGHARIFVLDGGLPRWIAHGRPLESGWREARHGDFKARFEGSLVVDLEAVRRTLGNQTKHVVDARPFARFTGEAPEPREAVRSGHMPGSLNVPWSEVVAEGALLPPPSLRAVFEAAGVDLSASITASCGSGISAALLALALARLGRSDVAVYDGSWAEWGSRDDTPVATGPGG